MYILGIANDETASACLLRDNDIISAVSEERFTRIKMDNSWPKQSIEYCLSEGNINLSDLDYVAYGWNFGFNPEKHIDTYFDRFIDEGKNGNLKTIEYLRERFFLDLKSDKLKRKEYDSFVNSNGLNKKNVLIDHHECHAYSAFLCSPFEEGLVITSDGRGDFTSLMVSEFSGVDLKSIYRATSFDSFGYFYGRITALLGFVPHRHEGKVTGLAAYGNPNEHIELMRKMIKVENGRVIASGEGNFKASFERFSDDLKSIIKNAKREDIAAAAQLHLEESIKSLVSYYIDKTKKSYICMAGGVFANVKLNQVLREIPSVKNVFIQPHMGDGGLALGSAVATYSLVTKKKPFFKTMFLGPKPLSDNSKEFLNGLIKIESKDIISTILEAISHGKIIGISRGRMEFGPRALCNRSIIYHCLDKTVNDWLNKRMYRTEFMPFAPVTAIEYAKKCYVDWNNEHLSSYFMTVTYNCTDEMKEKCPAVVHVDGTARPQIVSPETNEFMHKLLVRGEKEYGYLSLINTSFNKHEEPIVCNAYDSISSLKTGMIDLLVLEDEIYKAV